MTVLGQRIRLDPNNVQATFLERCAGTARFAYNWGLARWKEQYAAGNKPSWWSLNAELNATKAVEFPWMGELPWAITNKALADLGSAFTHFFRRVKQGGKPGGKLGYPRFKKKGRVREGFAVEGRALAFVDKQVKIPKLGWVRTQQELRFPGKILSARFSKRASHWYVSVQVEVDETSWSYPHRCETQAVVGVDLGVRDLAVLSTGEKIEAPRGLRRLEARLRMLNKELSRRTRGGTNWKKTKLKLARLHERISNVRRDVTHKLTTALVHRFAVIGIEDLNVAGMVKNRRLAKSVSDAAMSEVRRQLAYKAVLAGSEIVVADRFFPSSKTCSDCGHVLAALPLSTREWSCAVCGSVHDRDVNAAVNLKKMALTLKATACRQGSSGSEPSRTKLSPGQEVGSLVFA